jgi:uncharacterized protein (DUF302 family)
MKSKIILFLICIPMSLSVFAVDGMINVASKHSFTDTGDRLEKILLKKGMKVFGRIPHSKGAASVGVDLLPLELIIFGNPKVGSPLMKCAKSVAIDLPQKALIWQDKNDGVWISYNSPDYLKARHNIEGCDKVLNKVSNALNKITSKAAN